MSRPEMAERFGGPTTDRYRVENHQASDLAALRPLGAMADGTPILVNRLLDGHDLIVAVGQIGPHRVAGFSGGAKMILPGVCGEAATAAVHWEAWRREGAEMYAVAENPVRLHMEAVAARAGLGFVVNAVLRPDGAVHDVYAGDFRAAFRRGAEACGRLLAAPLPAADIVIADSHPYDVDFWQACKAISVAELVVRPGGTIVLVTPCPEGLSSHAPRIERTGYLPASEVLRRVTEEPDFDLLIACHLMALGRILERGRLIVVSPGLPPAALARVGLEGADSVAAAVRSARRRSGTGGSVVVLRDACKIIPVTEPTAPLVSGR